MTIFDHAGQKPNIEINLDLERCFVHSEVLISSSGWFEKSLSARWCPDTHVNCEASGDSALRAKYHVEVDDGGERYLCRVGLSSLLSPTKGEVMNAAYTGHTYDICSKLLREAACGLFSV